MSTTSLFEHGELDDQLEEAIVGTAKSAKEMTESWAKLRDRLRAEVPDLDPGPLSVEDAFVLLMQAGAEEPREQIAGGRKTSTSLPDNEWAGPFLRSRHCRTVTLAHIGTAFEYGGDDHAEEPSVRALDGVLMATGEHEALLTVTTLSDALPIAWVAFQKTGDPSRVLCIALSQPAPNTLETVEVALSAETSVAENTRVDIYACKKGDMDRNFRPKQLVHVDQIERWLRSLKKDDALKVEHFHVVLGPPC